MEAVFKEQALFSMGHNYLSSFITKTKGGVL
jgi:hypothetical protein